MFTCIHIHTSHKLHKTFNVLLHFNKSYILIFAPMHGGLRAPAYYLLSFLFFITTGRPLCHLRLKPKIPILG